MSILEMHPNIDSPNVKMCHPKRPESLLTLVNTVLKQFSLSSGPGYPSGIRRMGPGSHPVTGYSGGFGSRTVK